jgi:16S rRNA C967 or C1407 C5-methylase (RsmB/RsmF family)
MTQQDYIDAMRSTFSSDQEVQDFLDSFRQELPKTIKVLTSRMDPAVFREKFTLYCGKLTKTQFGTFDDMFTVDRGDATDALGKNFLHLLGFFYIQELAASIPPHFMDIPDNGLILDMCASP